MTDSFAGTAQRPIIEPDRLGSDRLTLALEASGEDASGTHVPEKEALAESQELFERAMRGEFGAWTISRAIDLAAQWPDIEALQVNAGKLLTLVRDARSAKRCWQGILQRFPNSQEALAEYAKAIAKIDGEAVADAIFEIYRPGEKRSDNADEVDRQSLAALDEILSKAAQWRQTNPPIRIPGQIGSVALIGGTLGSGGAERQLVNTAIGLKSATSSLSRIGDISVLCRKLDRRRGNDFYLPRLQAADIRVIDYLRAKPFGGDPKNSRLASYRPNLEKLPHRMREGTVHLTDLLRFEAPDVVQIWQDGAIFAAGLAALIANVPRIVLNVRTMPPSERVDRRRPEQRLLYGRLLEVSRCTLATNSQAASDAYADWLAIDPQRISVVPNGVDVLPIEGRNDDRTRWAEFCERGGSGFVLGGIMRLDDNKRPLEWLEMAAAFLRECRHARFVLVGHGPLRTACEELARRKQIADRLLIVGRSDRIGFWLDKMDALALTSRHEGLPNVLIEAQLAGVPVVTTPAGGAAEAVANHRANLVLQSAETVPIEQAIEHLVHLAAKPVEEARSDGMAIAGWAGERFSTRNMISKTIALFSDNR